MAFCKIIQNGNVIDVGTLFVIWNDDHKRFYHCDPSDGQFILSSLYDGKIYRDAWMRPCSKKAVGYENATVLSISQIEYDDIFAQLQEGETVSEDAINLNEISTLSTNLINETSESALTISEMRRIVAEQQNTIQLLTNCLLALSQEVYK